MAGKSARSAGYLSDEKGREPQNESGLRHRKKFTPCKVEKGQPQRKKKESEREVNRELPGDHTTTTLGELIGGGEKGSSYNKGKRGGQGLGGRPKLSLEMLTGKKVAT